MAQTSISDFVLLIALIFSPLTYLKVLYCIINGFSLEQTFFFFATAKIKTTETTFHSYFFLLDSKSVTLIFRLYILGFLHEYIGSYVKA